MPNPCQHIWGPSRGHDTQTEVGPGCTLCGAPWTPTADAAAAHQENERLRALLLRARKWIAATPTVWPNEDVISLKKDIDRALFTDPFKKPGA